jgi:S1-C subfamily serine protease
VDSDKSKESITMIWLGATIKNIETTEERSASGLNKTAGVVILKIAEESVLGIAALKVGDVIIGGEGEEINQIQDLMKVFQGHNWKGKINFKIFRNQKPMDLVVGVKK